ncbi:methyltransferase [Rouxiella sp. Mn2063]|uniref:methyltransferase n=1 Tax=Rouxiella sp. Mn2063 TaxID=3395262 RepID=UPI003BD869AC
MLLDRNKYKFRQDLGIWARPDYMGIPYSDGDAQEDLLLNIVQNTKDLSVSSSELRERCNDWVTTYHFSSLRSNLLRPLKSILQPGKKILEIGAGCGAITRFLGEEGADILALEGSLRRANIARTRTGGLDNVTVLSERFDDFECESKFDIVTLIGVLEYSNLFSDGSDSAIYMLNKIKKMLKPDGKLIIAIENQLGLKYFAGAAEDHLSLKMYGVEGRYTKQQPETFGHEILTQKLSAVGLKEVETLLPFPDYKLPVSVVTSRGANDSSFDASVFAAQSAHADLQLPNNLNFVLELAWPVVFKNKLGIPLSNSFLMVACAEPIASIDEDILAIHYGNERYTSFCKETVFRYADKNSITVNRSLLNLNQKPNDDNIDFELDGCEKYIKGTLLSTEFVKIVTTPGWKISQVAKFFFYYLECLEVCLNREDFHYGKIEQDTIIPDDYLDAIPSNIIIDEGNQPHYFEREWLAKNGLSVGALVFRSALSLLGKVSCFSIPEYGYDFTRGDFIRQLFEALSFVVDDEVLDNYLKLESDLHAYSIGSSERKINTWYPEHTLPGLSESNQLTESNIYKLNELHNAKNSAEKLAFERIDEINKLSDAKNYAEKLAFERIDEINKLNDAKISAENLAFARMAEINKLIDANEYVKNLLLKHSEEISLLSEAKDNAEKLLAERVRELDSLYEAKNSVEKLAIERLDELNELANVKESAEKLAIARMGEIDKLADAKNSVERLAIERMGEINKLSDAKDSVERLAIERMNELNKLVDEKDSVERLAIERMNELNKLANEKDSVEKLAIERIEEINKLSDAKNSAESLASQRFSEIKTLSDAKNYAEKLAFERLEEINKISDAKELAEKLAIERMDEIEKIKNELKLAKSGFLWKLSNIFKGKRI